MTAGTVSLRYLILGLFAQQPRSGYDIKRFFKGLNWLIGSPSSGSLYPILRTLRQEGLVSVEVIPGLDRPPRKIYSITQAGWRALQAWLERPAVANAPLKAFVMRLLLADSFSPSLLLAHMVRRRAQVADQQAALQEMSAALDGGSNLGQHLALDYGLALATAELAWLDGALGELSGQTTA
jgi:DNA-binding PadR family transcriptional regulator